MIKNHALQKELSRLKSEKSALQIQSQLLDNFVNLARSAAQEHLLTKILQKTLKVSAELTGAEKGSLFLLDARGAVTDSILTRTDATPEQSDQIIGNVFTKGLAGWVKTHHQVGLISDTETDDRWVDLPEQPYKVGSALAVPILRGENLLGILTLLHSRSGHFTRETADLMLLTASQIGGALENARLYSRLESSYQALEQAKSDIEAYSEALDAEMEKGKKIQRDFLPKQMPCVQGWEIATCFHPAKQVSGDFYDAFLLPGNLIGLVIADVCDKGVGSALFMALFRSLIRVFSGQISLQGVSVSGFEQHEEVESNQQFYRALHAVSLTNDYIAIEHGDDAMFATLFFGVLEADTGVVHYINAGHEPAVIVNFAGIKKSLAPTGPAVGLMANAEFQSRQVQIEPGDTLLGFTDGVTDALSPDRLFFTKERLMKILESPAPTASTLIDQIKSDLYQHIANEPQSDDITMIAVHRKTASD